MAAGYEETRDSEGLPRDWESIRWENEELFFIGHDCLEFPEVLATTYGPHTRRLDISFNTLHNLKGLEMFSRLEELIVDNNYLDDDADFFYIPTLHTLSVNKNRIKNLELLLKKIKDNFPSLRYLSLLGNEACPNQLSCPDKDDEDYQRYRYLVLHTLPGLKFLDSTPVSDDEQSEAERVGAYMKVMRPKAVLDDHDVDIPRELLSAYNPLPQGTTRPEGSHSAAFGVCRYRYSGKHSEGNRFILNNDL